jgi:RND family efflux transporter MFP subunit
MSRHPLSRWPAALLFAAAVAAAGCSDSAPTAVATEPPVVLVAAPVGRAVTDAAEYTGRVEAKDFVNVRARVSGYLVKINFKEGKDVQKGDVLFEIDPRPYQAALDQANAQIELAKAKEVQTKADVERNRRLVNTGGVAKADFDKIVADAGVAAAEVEAAKAQAESARLNLGFCQITSPIAGRISRFFVTEGNLIAADQTLLTTIVSQDPIYVYFDIDEQTVLHIQELIRAGKFKSARTHDDVPVRVGLANEPGRFPHEGTVNFVDNRIDPTTGTIKVRARLDNPILAHDNRLFTAGLFVRVQVPLGEPRKALLISERAVGTDQGQKFVYVVTDKNEVALQPVTLGQMHDGLRVVEDGLKGGEKVIVIGLQRVRPGMAVTPKPGEMTPNVEAAPQKS